MEARLNASKGAKADIAENLNVTVRKDTTITSGDDFMLKNGSASITTKKDGTVTIKGKDITIDGSGKISVKADKDVAIKGSKVHQN
jgi:type VI secretion system secreted protein VgrG